MPLRQQADAPRHQAAVVSTSRWWKYLTRRGITCPHGHHIPVKSKINETGFLMCDRWIQAERRECGLWVFVFAIRGDRCIVAQVSLDEQDEMDQLQTPAAMLDYLGIFPH